ncbi:uncharacterized protein A4U43_C03F30120 [Asparagus officinalis]|uniref:Uncharacterized protein n=1 Tax=Asparagus officinalis TaxID=4686 RepID=A0A5P1FJ07_ASPOF|nr:uncharacterized protein A4U43_C03F30120 [Asparagus officinalis]
MLFKEGSSCIPRVIYQIEEEKTSDVVDDHRREEVAGPEGVAGNGGVGLGDGSVCCSVGETGRGGSTESEAETEAEAEAEAEAERESEAPGRLRGRLVSGERYWWWLGSWVGFGSGIWEENLGFEKLWV